MYHRCAELLAEHAAKVFEIMTGLRPGREVAASGDATRTPGYTLGVRVEFAGRTGEGAPLEGFFVCAFETFESARDIAGLISRKLGLETPAADDRAGVDDVLGEFLNIVIGLTCSDWAERGLATVFDPPQPMVVHSFSDVPPGSRGFHLTLSADGHPGVSIFLVFLSDGARPSE
ncbi:MAG: hypothetical protein LBO05_00680 [Deltaproteobacteria bacterium]|nr:hypothetical protein [Deltaproteobacteria bacterium]